MSIVRIFTPPKVVRTHHKADGTTVNIPPPGHEGHVEEVVQETPVEVAQDVQEVDIPLPAKQVADETPKPVNKAVAKKPVGI